MWISKEEYNQLKTERDFYHNQLKDWEINYNSRIDSIEERYKEDITDLERCISEYERELDRKNELIERLEEKDIFVHMNRVGKELKSKDDEIEHFKEKACNAFRSYDKLRNKYDKMQVNLDAVKHDLFMSENEVSQVREALDYEAKRNNELFKLNNRLCDKISELEKENNEFKNTIHELSITDFYDAYFLESEIKQLIDLLDVALRDMNLHSNCTLYELEYDSKAHIYRIVTTPKTK